MAVLQGPLPALPSTAEAAPITVGGGVQSPENPAYLASASPGDDTGSAVVVAVPVLFFPVVPVPAPASSFPVEAPAADAPAAREKKSKSNRTPGRVLGEAAVHDRHNIEKQVVRV